MLTVVSGASAMLGVKMTSAVNKGFNS